VAEQPRVTGTRINILDDFSSPEDWGFGPATVNIRVGDTVTWVNTGVQPHTATARDLRWDTQLIDPGSARSLTFDREGTYIYICKPHPWMVAQLVVSAGAAAPAAPAPAAPAPAPPPAARPGPAPVQMPR
jgi:hypothetical protein